MKYRITESTVDAELFAMEMEDAVASGFTSIIIQSVMKIISCNIEEVASSAV